MVFVGWDLPLGFAKIFVHEQMANMCGYAQFNEHTLCRGRNNNNNNVKNYRSLDEAPAQMNRVWTIAID